MGLLTTSNRKSFNYKVIDCIENCNFGIDHTSKIVKKNKFQISKYVNLKQYCGTKYFQMKKFSTIKM